MYQYENGRDLQINGKFDDGIELAKILNFVSDYLKLNILRIDATDTEKRVQGTVIGNNE